MKAKVKSAILLTFVIILPILWMLLSGLAIKSNFLNDVYIDEDSIRISGTENVTVTFTLKNDSQNSYGGQFLHINNIKNGEFSGYEDYKLDFIGANSSNEITVTTRWSKEELDTITVSVRDENDSGKYITLSNVYRGGSIDIITYVGWAIIIVACVLMLYKAIMIQIEYHFARDNK